MIFRLREVKEFFVFIAKYLQNTPQNVVGTFTFKILKNELDSWFEVAGLV